MIVGDRGADVHHEPAIVFAIHMENDDDDHDDDDDHHHQ